MTRRRAFRIALPILAGIVVVGVLWRLWAGSSVGRAESAVRDALSLGWAGTNEARRIIRELPTEDALTVLVELLRTPDPPPAVFYRVAEAVLPDAVMKRIGGPNPAGPVEFCAYHWLAEALSRTNATVDPLLPLIRERPRLFWNVVAGPLVELLRSSPDEVPKLLPLLRHKDVEVQSEAAYLLASSDREGVSEPDFRWLVTVIPGERLKQTADGLVRVTRVPKETADWLWAEMERTTVERAVELAYAVQQLEPRIRREPGFLGTKLDSTNAAVRVAGLRVASNHPARAASVFGRIRELARSGSSEERELAAEACVWLVVSPKRELPMRVEAARIVRASGNTETLKTLRRATTDQRLPEEVEAVLTGSSP